MSTTEQATKKGHFCWADLAAKDLAESEKFYSDLLGWGVHRMDMGGGHSYTMLTVGESEIGGMYQMDPAQKKQGMPSFWTSYVLVDDVDSLTKTAKDFGAGVVVGPLDVGDKGRMTVLQEPGGAMFAIWADKGSESVSASGIGTICWHELMTTDVDVSNIFYKSVFKWKRQSMDFPGIEYFMMKLGDEPVGGMMTVTENDTHPHWLIHVSVEDCDKTAEKAKELGGKILNPPTDFEGVGRGAILMDPSGGMLGIIKLNAQS